METRPLRMEVDKDKPEVWFRLYADDAIELRETVDPGSEILIRAKIRAYLRKGGYQAKPEGEAPSVIRYEDAFTVDIGDLGIVKMLEPIPGMMEIGPLARLRSVGLEDSVTAALSYLRAGLDSSGSGIEEYHEAEEILSKLLGSPIWQRPE